MTKGVHLREQVFSKYVYAAGLQRIIVVRSPQNTDFYQTLIRITVTFTTILSAAETGLFVSNLSSKFKTQMIEEDKK